MINVIRADLYKVFRGCAIWICVAISTTSALVITVFSHLFYTGAAHLSSGGMVSILTDASILSQLACVMSGLLLCGDFENKSVAACIAAGHGRLSIVVGKSIAYFIVCFVPMLSYFFVALGAFFTKAGFIGDFVASPFLGILVSANRSFTTQFAAKYLAAFLVTAIIYVGQFSICVLFAFMIKKTAVVIGVSYFLSMFIGMTSGSVDKSCGFGKALSYLPFYQSVSINSTAGEFARAAALCIGFIAGILILTWLIFRKSDVK